MNRSLHGLIADGVVGGVLAGLVVALWFLAVDSLAGRPFHTPAALASALARQEIGPPTFRLVMAYSVLHFGVFAVLGVARSEEHTSELQSHSDLVCRLLLEKKKKKQEKKANKS